ncbi:MAG: biopolymer transporter TolR [Gammaproteobacteria bacterium]|nr:MAG: biopolymer transporter TolR [Gammaproteobacteria bacterium]
MLLNLDPAPRREMISLTPLIDIVFILLLFFMLTSSFSRWQQIELLTPSLSSDSQTPIIRVLKLESNQGNVSFEGQMLLSQDANKLAALIKQEPKATYVITVSKGIHTQAVVTLLDNLKQAGAYQVSLAGVLP